MVPQQVNGIAAAAGCQLVATCDIVIAGKSSKFSTPGAKVGLFCSTPGIALARAVPRKLALDMLMTADFITAERKLLIIPQNLVTLLKDLKWSASLIG
uniref:Enoyl-CoA hydratase n=1 Tax=Parascaris equorum TaxID=6256 RepID=A0A914S5N3_PAREQ